MIRTFLDAGALIAATPMTGAMDVKALAGSPCLPLLDEPTAGLSPAVASMITTLLQQLNAVITILGVHSIGPFRYLSHLR